MTINALNSGAKVWLADFEDANGPLWENMIEGQRNLRDALDGTIDFTSEQGKAYKLNDEIAVHGRPAPRLAPAREAPARRRRAHERQPVRLRALLLPLRAAPARRRPRPVLLPAEDGEPPRGPALERRLHLRRGPLRPPARHHPRHRAHRDLPGGVRDGGDRLRAARALGRSQRRPLGLHLQRHQEVPHPRQGVPAAGPGRR